MPITNITLATIIPSRYRRETATKLAAALDEVCSPADNYGFSSSGIYVFWDFNSGEVMYVGIAIDLALRFKQHNGLVACDALTCKREQVIAYLEDRGDLGYSVLVQSPIDQGLCRGWELAHKESFRLLVEEFGYLSARDMRELINTPLVRGLRWVEGALIRGFMNEYGRRPAWNQNAGAEIGYHPDDLARARQLLDATAFRVNEYTYMRSHCSMFELAASARFTSHESFLHGARLLRRTGLSLKEACALLPERQRWTDIQSEDYLSKMADLSL